VCLSIVEYNSCKIIKLYYRVSCHCCCRYVLYLMYWLSFLKTLLSFYATLFWHSVIEMCNIVVICYWICIAWVIVFVLCLICSRFCYLYADKQYLFIGSQPSDHYFRSVCSFVCLFVCAEFFSAVFLSRHVPKLSTPLYRNCHVPKAT